MTEPTPHDFAMELLCKLIATELYSDDPDASLSDLLADLMHLVDYLQAQGIEVDDFPTLLERADMHYSVEVQEHATNTTGFEKGTTT